ncbi:hypothetical protein RFI_26270, partial [Reticulomyxa filosa]
MKNLPSFQTLSSLSDNFYQAQCIVQKHEILVCGQGVCYSYFIPGNKYKLVCQYPNEYLYDGNHILKLPNKDDSKETILWLLGGPYGRISVMNYVSVWKKRGIDKTAGYNEWNPLLNSNKEPICISKKNYNYREVRTVIGGSNNHLLFITYYKSIDVFDLNTYKYVANVSLPIINRVNFNYFGSEPEKPFAVEMLPPIKNKKSKMLLFYESTGLSIEYDEDNKLFQFDNLR